MKNIMRIALQSLRIVLKDKSSVVWILIVPVVYISIFGNVFNFQNDVTKYRANLSILNQDNGFLSDLLIQGIASENVAITQLDSLPAEPPLRLLIIPPNFTTRVLAEHETQLQLQKKPDSDMEAEMTAKMAVRKSYIRILASMAELKIDNAEIDSAQIAEINQREGLIYVESRYAGKHKIVPTGFNHQVPANIVMFTMLVLFIYAGNMILDEKRNGLLRRIAISPVQHWQLFSGKLLGGTLVGIVQILILLAVGRFVFGVYYGPSPAALVVLSLLFAMTVSAIGLSIGMFFESEEKVTGLGIILAISMSAISGCWWPLEIAPGWMAQIASILPSGIALSGYHQLISYGRGFQAVLPNIIQLLLTTVLFALVFANRLSKQQY